MSPTPSFWSTVRLLLVVAIVAAGVSGASAMAGGSPVASVTPLSQSAADGAAIYAENCATCHQPGGVGIVGTFPPLAGNPASADAAYVEDVVRNGLSGPIEVLGVTYDATMASFADLSDDDVAALVEYVATLAEGGGAVVPDDEPAVEPGHVDDGRALFIGSDRFDAGGGSCAGCHTAGDVGNLGGWGLGPDLTDSVETFGGEAGLSGWLANPSSPVMRPIFADRPMTDAEIADVVAFLADAPDQKRPTDPGDGLLYAGGAGLLVLIVGMAIAWRGMRQTYVERLRSKR